MLFRRSVPNPEVLVSETDIEAALAHLRLVAPGPPSPLTWDRERFLTQLRGTVGPRPNPGDYIPVAPGVFAVIEKLGLDKPLWDDSDPRLVVWLYIRSCRTDRDRMITL